MKPYGSKIINGGNTARITDNQTPHCRCCNGKYAVTTSSHAKSLRGQKRRARRWSKREIEDQTNDKDDEKE